MKKTILYIAMSLDGYIARENGDIDWLEAAEGEGDNGYGDFIKSVDTVVMGRKTYEQILGFQMEFPYQEQDCYVFSSERTGRDENVQFVTGSPDSLIRKLKAKPGKDLWIAGGGELIHHFMKEELVDSFMIAVIPVLLGKGIPLFQSGFSEQALRLEKVQTYKQIVVLSYEKK
ncbi:dihydrofolate reductase [Bacillus mangrovi]|uniref:Dihydrofolate reductase n=1 Tax=Metabacillus mangrovi TaxID=1491830 RepID=A0A7X2S8P6_9BACI|nr:dihydrofolate reductase family protein [Metabacillus mangrovi]MTH55432.1 dihydrofolate reductase [Metabacillus mangrovi]